MKKMEKAKGHNQSMQSIKNFKLMIFGVITLFFFCGISFTNGMRINQNGGYEDIIISVGHEVPPIACQQIIQNLQDILTSASEYQYIATKGKTYFHKVQIILPQSWDSRACGQFLPKPYTSTSTVNNADIRITSEHPIFGHMPFTQQSQSCGKPGDFISLGYNFILQPQNETIEKAHISPDRFLVKEFAKLRYGVFEEVGYENDLIYPLTYIDDGGNDFGVGGKNTGHSAGPVEDGRKPNSCSNKPVKGNWSSPSCNPAKGPSDKSCLFVSSNRENDNITSSIMSVSNLPNVRSFCDSSNHNKLAPNKQNFHCDRKSISNVIFSHPDFLNLTPSSRNGKSIKPIFEIKQLTIPKFVLMIEESRNMNLRDVWKYLKLAIRKFIKYDLPNGTQLGFMTIGSDYRILANMTTLDENLRSTMSEKLPNYPSTETNSGSLALRKGISKAINMLKSNGQAAGSVIILVSQGTISPLDLETSLHLLKNEEVSMSTIEYPSVSDGKISFLSQGTNSPHYSIKESGVGPMSHMSTYIQLLNALTDIQRFFTKNIASKWPILLHQEEFKGDAPSFVESSFSFDASSSPAQFYVFIPNPIDPKVNKVELINPSGVKFTDQLSYLHDINVIKIDAIIDQPGIWRYRIERLGDSHQSHFVQVISYTTQENFSVRVFTNVEETRTVNMASSSLILYAEIKRGNSPVLYADVEATISAPNEKWTVKLFDSGNGDPDITKDDGIYSRYILPYTHHLSTLLEITVKVTTSPYRSRFIGYDSSNQAKDQIHCCGSSLIQSPNSVLKPMPYNERIVASYVVKVINVQGSDFYVPSRIGDLMIVGIVNSSIVQMEFTAPGEDFDQGLLPIKTYQIFSSKGKEGLKLKEEITTLGVPSGQRVLLNSTFTDHSLYYIQIVAVDSFGKTGKPSNLIQVKLLKPDENLNGTYPESLNNRNGGKDKLSSSDIALIVVGVIGFFVLIAALILIIICCRRKSSKTMGSTETKISTISDVKAPIHWSASELLHEHEKRQSIYAQGGHTQQQIQHGQIGQIHDHGGGGGGSGDFGYQKANTNTVSSTASTNFGGNDISPGSSTRSFRSIGDGSASHQQIVRDSIVMGQGPGGYQQRRPTLPTDYESCSSDPTLKSMRGVTDYDSCDDPDNYRTFDSYTGLPYRLPPPRQHQQPHQQQQQHIQQHISQYPYNPNIQGSLTSVNSKRRNITMV